MHDKFISQTGDRQERSEEKQNEKVPFKKQERSGKINRGGVSPHLNPLQEPYLYAAGNGGLRYRSLFYSALYGAQHTALLLLSGLNKLFSCIYSFLLLLLCFSVGFCHAATFINLPWMLEFASLLEANIKVTIVKLAPQCVKG